MTSLPLGTPNWQSHLLRASTPLNLPVLLSLAEGTTAPYLEGSAQLSLLPSEQPLATMCHIGRSPQPVCNAPMIYLFC